MSEIWQWTLEILIVICTIFIIGLLFVCRCFVPRFSANMMRTFVLQV